MRVSSPLLGCRPDTGPWLIWGLNRSWIWILRGFFFFFFKNTGTEIKTTWCKIREQGRCGKVWMISSERYSYTSFDSCAGALSWRSLIPCVPEVGQAFSVVFVQFWENTVSVALPSRCSFLPCMVSVAQCSLSKNKYCVKYLLEMASPCNMGHIPTFWNQCFVHRFS